MPSSDCSCFSVRIGAGGALPRLSRDPHPSLRPPRRAQTSPPSQADLSPPSTKFSKKRIGKLNKLIE